MPTPSILRGIFQFEEYLETNREVLDHLAHGSPSPEALIIACCDSRVSPDMLVRLDPGSLFVARNVGNVVPPFGTGEMSIGAVIEYAVLHLRTHHIIICGHTDCGAIEALDAPSDWSRESHIARWIEYIRPARTKVQASGLSAEEQQLATVRENVLLQMQNLRSYDPVREGERTKTLELHGWVYHIETGAIRSYNAQTEDWLPLTIK